MYVVVVIFTLLETRNSPHMAKTRNSMGWQQFHRTNGDTKDDISVSFYSVV